MFLDKKSASGTNPDLEQALSPRSLLHNPQYFIFLRGLQSLLPHLALQQQEDTSSMNLEFQEQPLKVEMSSKWHWRRREGTEDMDTFLHLFSAPAFTPL